MVSQPNSRLDRAFARFRDSGDPTALGEVFDGAAPELLRLASHLISDLALAEDLVQATFLVAIESSGDYDPSRPVLPWLVGILTNQARLLRRARGRQPDPERLTQSDSADPAEAIEAKEITSTVTDAISRLPESYRPILMMHLRHGFSPQEIALTLGRPPGSVRKQLSRALCLLRKALPGGFAATVSTSILPARGLAAMKETILSAARLSYPSSVATAVLAPTALQGVLLMKKTLCIAAAIVAATYATSLAWPDPVSRVREAPDMDKSPSQTGAIAGADRAKHPTVSNERRQLQTTQRSKPPREITAARQSTPTATAEPEESVPGDDRPRLTKLPKIAQRQAAINECLAPRYQIYERVRGEKFESLKAKLRSDHPQYYRLIELARKLDDALLAYRVAKLDAQVQAFKDNDLLSLAEYRRKHEKAQTWRNYIDGHLGWAPGPGPLWGDKGAVVDIKFVLDLDKYHRLNEAIRNRRKVQNEFDKLLRQND